MNPPRSWARPAPIATPRLPRVLAVATVLVLAACGPESPASLAIDLRTDLVPEVEFDHVRIVLDGERRDRASSATDVWPDGVRVARIGGLRPGTTAFVLQVFRDDVIIVERPTDVRLRPGDNAVTVVVTRSCLSVVCPRSDPALTACLGGRCVDPGCTEDTPERCPMELECVAAADCAPMAACSVAQCVSRACVYAPRPRACDPDESCIPEVGCVDDRPADAGPDAGVDATIPDGSVDAPEDAGCPPSPGCVVGGAGECSCGMTCGPGTANSECVPAGTLPPNAICERDGAERCVQDHLCVVPRFTPPRCQRLCTEPADCGIAAEWMCLAFPTAASGGVCHRRDCDLNAQNCGPDEGCFPLVAVGHTYCEHSGTFGLDASCIDSTQCRAGLICIDDGGGQICVPVCNPDAADVCPRGSCQRGGSFWGACF